MVSSSGFFYKSNRCSKTTSVPLLLALTNLVRIERTVLASSNSFIRSRSLMVDTNKYYQGFPDSSRCKCSTSVFFSFLPPYLHGHRDCHHLLLILLSAHDVAFVSVFYFLERRKNEEKEAEDTRGRLSNRLADSHAILIRTKKEEVGYGGSG